MSLFGLFGKKKNAEKIQLSERKKNILQDTAVAATFAEAGELDTARSMLDTSKGQNTILMIGSEDSFSEQLVDYAVAMAKRLECEIMAVNITEAPLSLAADRKNEAIAIFEKNCADNCTFLKQQAADSDIRIDHRMEVGNQDMVIETIHSQYPGMRYVLTEPDPESVQKSNTSVSIPVFDLGSFQGAAA